MQLSLKYFRMKWQTKVMASFVLSSKMISTRSHTITNGLKNLMCTLNKLNKTMFTYIKGAVCSYIWLLRTKLMYLLQKCKLVL